MRFQRQPGRSKGRSQSLSICATSMATIPCSCRSTSTCPIRHGPRRLPAGVPKYSHRTPSEETAMVQSLSGLAIAIGRFRQARHPTSPPSTPIHGTMSSRLTGLRGKLTTSANWRESGQAVWRVPAKLVELDAHGPPPVLIGRGSDTALIKEFMLDTRTALGIAQYGKHARCVRNRGHQQSIVPEKSEFPEIDAVQ